jgi:photosystem II stability/assembly factor-like uncharacterized protein
MGVDQRTGQTDQRIWGRGWYFCVVVVDPKNPDKLYVSNTSIYRSDDGGQTFIPIKGAPGGDDYHQVWIYPDDGNRMILSSDQGVEVSVDGGLIWSSWYNQPTAQIYHIVADNQDPYWVYGAQQDSGAVKSVTRGIEGNINYLSGWAPICAGGESGYVAVDPSNSNVLYGGTVSTCNQDTNSGHNITPMLGSAELGPFRHTWTLPLVFSQAAGHALYFSNQYLWKTTDKGRNWVRISKDMTRENPGAPQNLDAATTADGSSPRPGVIYTIAPSPLAADTIWIGTDDGLIHVTRDGGKNWSNVTPPEMTAWSKVALMDASHTDAGGAYAAVDRHRLEDYKPYIYRTHDGGKSWKLIVNGIPDGSYVNAVKEDPLQKGLLFAGTELGVYVSFDDGDNWQSLQLNLPHSSARDFAIHGDDLIVATHGRGFWVLDDITALRQITAMKNSASDTMVFKPQTAIRRRTGGGGGTPLPYGSAEAQNPPSGAIIDYYLKSAANGPVTLDILDGAGKTVRSYSSAGAGGGGGRRGGGGGGGGRGGAANIPAYWTVPPVTLSAAAGMHRWEWDMHYTPVEGAGGGGRGGGGGGIWALPGTYTVKLTADGKSYTVPLKVVMDPRVKTPLADLQRQNQVANQVTAKSAEVATARGEVARMRVEIASLRAKATGNASLLAALDALDKKAADIGGVTAVATPDSSGVAAPSNDVSSLMFVGGELGQIEGAVEGPDAAPSQQVMSAFAEAQKIAAAALAKWSAVKAKDLVAVNDQLKAAGLTPISLEGAAPVAGRGRRGD